MFDTILMQEMYELFIHEWLSSDTIVSGIPNLANIVLSASITTLEVAF